MNLLWQALASEAWASLVKALLHTLWIGALAAGGLYFSLRWQTDPRARYRRCVAALLVVVLGGVLAWSVNEDKPKLVPAPAASSQQVVVLQTGGNVVSSPQLSTARSSPAATTNSALPVGWTPWLALVWLGGALVMLARSGSLVARAEKLRRRSRPLENEVVSQLFEEARRKLGLARRIQVRVTEELTSPAVMGWLTPVLILPLSMLTTLPVEQIQLILLHELAHIRRGDYLVNLGQLVAESLLFFNPAFWWISRQIRQEREACCDAVAIALAGEPVQYARTLAEMAGTALAAAPAFGDRRNPSGLKDRIQRLLVPGYRPVVRLTWCALLAAFVAGGGLLFLSAIGTRAAVQAILSPQERVERIEKKINELGVVVPGLRMDLPKINVAGRIWMADGTPMPSWISMDVVSVSGHSSSGMGTMAHHGVFSNAIQPGTIFVTAEVTNFAPVEIGPFNGMVTNQLDNLLVMIDRGFDARIQVVDADSDKPLAGARLRAQYWIRGASQTSFVPRTLTTDVNGSAIMAHAADLPLVVVVNVPGHEIFTHRFESVPTNEPLRIALHAGSKVFGTVLDKTSGQPIAGAELHLLYQTSEGTQQQYAWADALNTLGKTDTRGAFVADQLPRNGHYYIGISAPGYESVVLSNVPAGERNLVAHLGPELVVRGRVVGNLKSLYEYEGRPTLNRTINETFETSSYSSSELVPLRIEDGVARFEFTNGVAGAATLTAGNQTFEHPVDAPVDDWVIDLNAVQKTEGKNVAKREVIFRFKDKSGATPRGRVSVSIPDNLEQGHLTAHSQEIELTNGEARAEIPIGGQTSVDAKSLVGYWFNHWTMGNNGGMFVVVTNGTGPMVVNISLLPAGAIYAKARNADGKPADEVSFGVSELKPAPGRGDYTLDTQDEGFSDGSPRQWAASPLPLGGTYEIYGWQGNSFCVSKPVKLTEANPDTEIELQFPPGKTFDGVLLDPDGKPLPNAELITGFTLQDERSFSLKSSFTDEQGRFRLEETSPELGKYQVHVEVPGIQAEFVNLKFGSQPQTIHLKRGRILAGHVVQAGTTNAIPDILLYASDNDHAETLPMLNTRTDANGRFEFKTLGDGNYSFFFQDGQFPGDKKFRADGKTNLVLPLTLYNWSKAKPLGAP